MTKPNDYEGAIIAAKQLKKLMGKAYRFYIGDQIPKDPQAIIDLAKQVKKDEALRKDAEIAKEYIIRTWKARKHEARMKRRAKLKKLFGRK